MRIPRDFALPGKEAPIYREGERIVIADYWREPPEIFTVICGDGLAYLRERRWSGGELVYLDR